VNAALARQSSAERVDHRSFKARGMERLPTVHVGKKGAVAKGRASLNVRLRAKNAQVLALDEQIGKLMRMRARLAARAEPTPDLQRVVRDVEETASDLLPWRRRSAAQMVPQRTVTAVLTGPLSPNSEANVSTPRRAFLRVLGRPRR
jgi:MobA/MobL family